MSRMTKMVPGEGDKEVAVWDETTSQEELDRIQEEFDQMLKEGGYAAFLIKEGLADGEGQIRRFDPNAKEILLVPQLQGG